MRRKQDILNLLQVDELSRPCCVLMAGKSLAEKVVKGFVIREYWEKT